MKIIYPLFYGVLIKRYKRFLADIILDDGREITAHCPNTGSMKQSCDPGSRVVVSLREGKNRKYPFAWELIEINHYWCCVNTIYPNQIFEEAIKDNQIPCLTGYETIEREKPYHENSRIDLLLSGTKGKVFVEVKNVTLMEGNTAIFPDAKTLRGQKHLKGLMDVVKNGDRGVMLFAIERGEAQQFSPAEMIDPEYARLLRMARDFGVEIYAWKIVFSAPNLLVVGAEIPVLF